MVGSFPGRSGSKQEGEALWDTDLTSLTWFPSFWSTVLPLKTHLKAPTLHGRHVQEVGWLRHRPSLFLPCICYKDSTGNDPGTSIITDSHGWCAAVTIPLVREIRVCREQDRTWYPIFPQDSGSLEYNAIPLRKHWQPFFSVYFRVMWPTYPGQLYHRWDLISPLLLILVFIVSVLWRGRIF